MKLINLLLSVGAVLAGQVTFIRPDTTQGSFSDAQGCYGIYPTVAKLLPFKGQAVQWYPDYNCQGQPLKVSTGAEDFSPPLNALSARIINQSVGPTNPQPSYFNSPYGGYYSPNYYFSPYDNSPYY